MCDVNYCSRCAASWLKTILISQIIFGYSWEYVMYNPLIAAIRGSGYKFFVTLYHEPAARLEHYLQNDTVIRWAG